MAGVRKKALGSGKYQGWYMDYRGTRKYFVGTSNRAETRRMSEQLDNEHRQIRLGYRPIPDTARKNADRPYEEIEKTYLDWGCAQGGRGGRPWGKGHARMRRSHLAWWRKLLALEVVSDLNGILPRVEAHLRELLDGGKAGKTVQNYAEAIRGICSWCVTRKYLSENPLKDLAAFDTTPKTTRRAIRPEEIQKLLESVPEHRRLLYEMAFCSGLRASELRSLSRKHLDVARSGLHLEAAWTKNRKQGFQPLPGALVQRLSAFAETGEADELYGQAFQKRKLAAEIPDNPLLYVASHPSRIMDADLERVGIPKWTNEGKLDFHGLRVAYISFVLEAGASVKEAQALARHSNADLTLNTYARARDERLSEITERVAKTALLSEKCAHSVHAEATGTAGVPANLMQINQLRECKSGADSGFDSRRLHCFAPHLSP